MLGIGCRSIFAPIDRTQPHIFHSAGNAVFADWKSHVIEFVSDFRATTTPFMSVENGFDANSQALVINSSLALRPVAPVVIAATRHRKSMAHLLNTPESAVLVYEFEYLFGSSEKMATAFFRMSRSCRRRSFSRLRRRSSSSSGLRWPLPGNA